MNSTNYLIMEKVDGNGNSLYYIVRKNNFARTEETYCFITKFYSNDEYKYMDCREYYGFADLSKKQNHKPPRGIMSWFMPWSCGGSTKEEVYYFSDLEKAKYIVRSFAPETTNVVAVM